MNLYHHVDDGLS